MVEMLNFTLSLLLFFSTASPSNLKPTFSFFSSSARLLLLLLLCFFFFSASPYSLLQPPSPLLSVASRHHFSRMLFKFFTPTSRFPEPNVSITPSSPTNDVPSSSETQPKLISSSNKLFEKWGYLELDPSKRTPILDYHPNDQDEVRRAYLVNGPTRPNMTEYPPRVIGNRNRSFNNSWYKGNDWLEYSIEDEFVYCLPCYLCYTGTSEKPFVNKGFNCCNLKTKLGKHIGELNSHHRKCVKACMDLMKKGQNIESSFVKYSSKAEADYLVRLKASLEAVKYLVRGGLAFRGHNEGENSVYKGHFLEFIEALARNSEIIAAAIKSGGGNCKMTSPIIQKELANACAVETIKKIVGEIGDDIFCVLIDESGDCSGKEQMAVVCNVCVRE